VPLWGFLSVSGFLWGLVSFVDGIEFLTDPGDAAVRSRPVWFVDAQAGRVMLELCAFLFGRALEWCEVVVLRWLVVVCLE
jgi:hypothetical protein